MSGFRHPSRSHLLRFVSRALIVAFVFALLPPAPAQAARTKVQDLAPELSAPELSHLVPSADPRPGLWLVALVDGEDLQGWFVVPDSELAGNYHRARWMDPSTGRWGSMDPWLGSPFGPATLHRYGYAANDPANQVDPSGLLVDGGLAGQLSTAFTRQTLAASELSKVTVVVAAGAVVAGIGQTGDGGSGRALHIMRVQLQRKKGRTTDQTKGIPLPGANETGVTTLQVRDAMRQLYYDRRLFTTTGGRPWFPGSADGLLFTAIVNLSVKIQKYPPRRGKGDEAHDRVGALVLSLKGRLRRERLLPQSCA